MPNTPHTLMISLIPGEYLLNERNFFEYVKQLNALIFLEFIICKVYSIMFGWIDLYQFCQHNENS